MGRGHDDQGDQHAGQQDVKQAVFQPDPSVGGLMYYEAIRGMWRGHELTWPPLIDDDILTDYA
jgi:hypothetical protein